MKKLKFVVAIPTFNRIECLKKTIESIINQNLPDSVDLEIAISNTCSDDGTYEYLNNLKTKIKIHVYNEKKIIPPNKLSQYVNFQNLSKVIPEDADWAWWLGDDDKLVGKNAIQKVVKCIQDNNEPDLEFVHACHANKVSNNEVINDSLFNLCQEFGYHEILGWMSSIIMKGKHLKYMLLKSSENKNYLNDVTGKISSAYSHSAYILKHHCEKGALFLDFPLVDNLNIRPGEDCEKRWEKENVGDRYFGIVTDLVEIQDFLPKKKLSKNFFRYHSYFIWDHLAFILIRKLNMHIKDCKTKGVEVEFDFQAQLNAQWEKIFLINELLDDNEGMKLLALTFQSGINYTNLYLNTGISEEVKTNYIDVLYSVIRGIPIFNHEIIAYKPLVK